jgi:hypothetical protein
MSTDPSDELASYPAATLQASKETPWIATPVPHGLGKVPGMLMHPDDGPELSDHLQAIGVRSCWSASLLH